jgi:predicted GNAT family N-acyltransferase
MPLFQSLSFVINDQIRQNTINMQSGLTLRSNVTQALQVINVNKNNIIEEQDVLRWGYANWGIEKVTSEYKPQEIK